MTNESASRNSDGYEAARLRSLETQVSALPADPAVLLDLLEQSYLLEHLEWDNCPEFIALKRALAAPVSERGTLPSAEPTIGMLRVIVYGSRFQEDWEIGKQAQMDGKPIPSKTEYEKAYGFYKRIITGTLPSERKER